MPSLRLVVASLALLVVAGSALSAQKPNFSGFWTLDRAASDITPPAFSGGRGGASDTRKLPLRHTTLPSSCRNAITACPGPPTCTMIVSLYGSGLTP